MGAVISVERLTKTYENGVTALRGIDFNIQAGEKVVLLGHNGSGKSTLFRCMSQFEQPTEGQVFVEGVNLPSLNKRTLRTYRKQMGIVFQHFNLVYNLSVMQNVLFGAMGRTATFVQVLAPFATRQLREEAMDCLEQVGLAHLAGVEQMHCRAARNSGLRLQGCSCSDRPLFLPMSRLQALIRKPVRKLWRC